MRAALELIERQGFEESRIVDIAERAGCSVGTFYHRFRDKAALFHALQEDFRRESVREADELLDPGRWEARPLSEVVDALAHYLVDGFRARRGFLRAALRQRMADPASWTAMRDSGMHLTGRFQELCRSRRDAIGHADPALAAGFAVQMMVGTLINAILNQPDPVRVDDPRLARELGVMARGYLALRD